MALYQFSAGPDQWVLRNVTREYGCVAPLSMRQWGSSLMFLSHRGLDRVQTTAFGVVVGTGLPVSFDMDKYVKQIDWNHAELASVETWGNRLFLAFPARGQHGTFQNNTVLSLNFQNTDLAKEEYGWEGAWTGASLLVYNFARLTVNGEERLAFCNYSDEVCWLNDGALDTGNVAIGDRLTTRRYTGGKMGRKVWQQALVVLDHNHASLTVSAIAPGWNEVYELTPAGGLQYDRTKYAAGEGADYDPNTQVPPFNNPWREDYSLAGFGELIGGQPDIHQNIPEKLRMRVDDWGVQLQIVNARGSCRVASVDVEGFAGPGAATRNV